MLYWWLAWSVLFQQPPAVSQDLEVGYVVLDVLAVDQEGRAQKDLQASDFTIYDSGRTIKPEIFQIIDFASPAAALAFAKGEDEEPFAQTLVMILELAAVPAQEIGSLLAGIKQFFAAMQPESGVQILIYSVEKGMLTHGFTSHPDEVVLTLEGLIADYQTAGNMNLGMVKRHSLVALEEAIEGCFPKRMTADPQSKQIQDNMVRQCIRSVQGVFAERQLRRSRGLLAVARKVIGSLAKVDGPKSLYLVSPGFQREPGSVAARLAVTYERLVRAGNGRSPFEGGSTASLTSTDGDGNQSFSDLFNDGQGTIARPGEYAVHSLEKELQELTHLALKTRTVVHTFTLPRSYQRDRNLASFAKLGPGRVAAAPVYLQFGFAQNESLAEVAARTGGRHWRTPKLTAALTQTLNESRWVYVLGYRAPVKGKKRFRKIEIDCAREGVQLHHHRGYFRKK